MKFIALIFCITLSMAHLAAQEKPKSERLYKTDKIPFALFGQNEMGEFDIPLIYPFVKEHSAEDIVFLVIPGGGYARVAINHEGLEVANRLNNSGYSAYVLFYRVPNPSLMSNRELAPLQDAVHAIDLIKERHPNKKIAVIGFSAGGHLAATLSNYVPNEKIKTKHSKLLDYSILAYPVISMIDSITHSGSKQNLIGKVAAEELINFYSMDQRVTSQTPPTFIMHAEDDKGVPIANTHLYIESLKKHQVPFESYIYTSGGHGFGLKNKQDSGDWFEKMLTWIKTK